jgi:hypothetical protein
LIPYLGRVIKNVPELPEAQIEGKKSEKRTTSASRIRVFDATKSTLGRSIKQKMT